MQTSHAPPKQSIAGATTNHEPPAEKVWPVQPHLSAPPCIPKYPHVHPILPEKLFHHWRETNMSHVWRWTLRALVFLWNPPGIFHCSLAQPGWPVMLVITIVSIISIQLLMGLLLSIINWSSNFSARATARAPNSADDNYVWSWSWFWPHSASWPQQP